TTPCVGTASARANNYYGNTSFLVSPALTGTNGGDLTVSFSYKVTQYSPNTSGQTLANLGVIKLQWATSTTGIWTDVYQIDNTNHVVSASCTVKSATFSGLPATGDVYIRFSVTSGASADSYVYFDDVVISQGAAPACLVPSALLSSNLTPTGATFAWTASPSSPSGNYDIYWSTTNTAPTSTTTPSTTNKTTPYSVTSLTPNTTYYWWVRSNCGAAGT